MKWQWKKFAQRAGAVAKIVAVAGILAIAFTAGNYIAAQKAALQGANSPGIFEAHGDVGTVLHPGSVEYDAAKQTYTIAGSGEKPPLCQRVEDGRISPENPVFSE